MTYRLIAYALLAFSFLLSAPTLAQINGDILTTETPDGGFGSGGFDNPNEFCELCAANLINDKDCCDFCGEQCDDWGSCLNYSLMSTAGISWSDNYGIRGSLSETRVQLEKTKRGSALLAVMRDNEAALFKIFEQNPELAKRAGRSMLQYWPWDMWTNTGPKAHKVSSEALKELRTLLTEVGKADRARGGKNISSTIRERVLPRLDKSLIGRPYHEALTCFASAEGCS